VPRRETGMTASQNVPSGPDYDVVIVGAGFAGLYQLHRLRPWACAASCWKRRPASAASGIRTAIRAPRGFARADLSVLRRAHLERLVLGGTLPDWRHCGRTLRTSTAAGI